MDNPQVQEQVFLIEVEKIVPNPFQPRKEFNEEQLRSLANSIREFGILQPLVVSKNEKETEFGISIEYQLIAGERRYRASKLVGLDRVPAIIRNIGLDRQKLEMAIVENVQRENLNPIESAKAYNRLQEEFNLTQREIASRIGKSRESVANTMRLLNLPSFIQEAISEHRLGESQARLLLSIPDIVQQQKLFEDIVNNNLSVRQLKSKIDYAKAVKAREERAAKLPDPEVDFVKKQIEDALGAPVKVERSGQTGKITLEFFSPEEFQSLVEKLTEKSQVNESANQPFKNESPDPTVSDQKFTL